MGQQNPDNMPRASQRVRLHYLDGVRGLAALFVVWHHVWQFVVVHNAGKALPAWFRAFAPLKLGGFGVAVFIVLSGYCLTIPVARSTALDLAGGLRGFAFRRARRILPPYYAALILSAVLVKEIVCSKRK